MQLEDYFEFEKFADGERIRVKGTRVAIDVLLDEFLKGAAPDDIQKNYPTVTREQVFATITYYLHNQEETDRYLKRNRELAEAAYQEWKRTHTPSPLEEKLGQLRAASTAKDQP